MGRTFSAEYKQRILAELDEALGPGERGAIVRREGLYWSTVSRWRQRRDAAVRAGLSDAKRGPKVDELALEFVSCGAGTTRSRSAYEPAEKLAEAQGKAFALLQALSRKSDDTI